MSEIPEQYRRPLLKVSTTSITSMVMKPKRREKNSNSSSRQPKPLIEQPQHPVDRLKLIIEEIEKDGKEGQKEE